MNLSLPKVSLLKGINEKTEATTEYLLTKKVWCGDVGRTSYFFDKKGEEIE